MRRLPRRRGVGRGYRDREAYQREIAGSPETPTAPDIAAPSPLESPDSTAATEHGARVPLHPIGDQVLRRRPRRRRWPWKTIWTAVGAIAGVLVLLAAAIWGVASLKGDIAVNAAEVRSLGDKHNTFATRVAEDIKRLETYIKELLDRRRENEPPARRR